MRWNEMRMINTVFKLTLGGGEVIGKLSLKTFHPPYKHD